MITNLRNPIRYCGLAAPHRLHYHPQRAFYTIATFSGWILFSHIGGPSGFMNRHHTQYGQYTIWLSVLKGNRSVRTERLPQTWLSIKHRRLPSINFIVLPNMPTNLHCLICYTRESHSVSESDGKFNFTWSCPGITSERASWGIAVMIRDKLRKVTHCTITEWLVIIKSQLCI